MISHSPQLEPIGQQYGKYLHIEVFRCPSRSVWYFGAPRCGTTEIGYMYGTAETGWESVCVPQTPYLPRKHFEKVQEKSPKHPSKILFLHITTFGKSKDTTGHQNLKLVFSFFNMVGQKQLASPSVFKKNTEIYDGGILVNLE